jgi:hypothetical protein
VTECVSSRRQMGKVNFGVILGWSVIMMTVLHWLFNMLAGPSVRLRLSQRAREMRPSLTRATSPRCRAWISTDAAHCSATACFQLCSSRP